MWPDVLDSVDVPSGQRLVVADWAGPGVPLVFVHGLSSTHRNAAAVAAAVAGRRRVIAMDLRGRGGSTRAKAGEHGMERHAGDVLGVLDAMGVGEAVVAGHSMGAYVVNAVAAARPSVVRGAVLIDGGVRLRDEPLLTPDQAEALLYELIAPVVERLRVTYATTDEYVQRFQRMPYFDHDDADLVADYAMYDLGLAPGGYRSKCDERAVVEDWIDLLCNPAMDEHLAAVRAPVLALAAEHGMEVGGDPVMGPVHLEQLGALLPDVECVTVPGSTHHSVTLSRKGAAATAEAVLAFADRVAG